MNEVSTRVNEFLCKFFRNVDLQDETDIFSLGFVNSLFAMQLITFLEKEFQITVENEDLDLDNFRSIRAITGFVERKEGQPLTSSFQASLS